MPAAGAALRSISTSPRIAIASTIADFEEETRNAAAVQKKVLSEILERNAQTEYLLEKCDLQGRTDIDAFKEKVPLVIHSDLKPYFDRIAHGDQSAILTAEPVTSLSLSSGTTSDGRQKYLILYKEILEASGRLGRVAAAYRGRAFPTKAGGKFLELVFSGKLSKTSGGLAAGTATTHLFRSEQFKQKQKLARVGACSPQEVVLQSNNREAMYCHLLCALLCWEDLEFITATFAYTFIEAFHMFELEWMNLCADICRGELNRRITDPDLRAAMAKVMRRPEPECAGIIAAKCLSLRGWAGLIPEIWPNCKYVYSIMTGSMEPYLDRLSHYAGSLPLVSADFGATESWIGVNVNPKVEPRDATFTVVPSFAYFEFIPIPSRGIAGDNLSVLQQDDDLEEELEPVGLTEVEVGRTYEVVLTTYGGLYRYRLGDVVRVTGFFNASPQVAYVCRKNVVLTLHIDKNTEKDLQIAVNEALEALRKHDANAELVDYTSFADLSSSPGHYRVFWELRRRSNTTTDINIPLTGHNTFEVSDKRTEQIAHWQESELKECATAMDLAFVDPGYVGSRKIKTIGALELCLVEPGTFRALLDRYLKRSSAAIAQYKTPRCIASQEVLDILASKVVFSVCSEAYS